MQDAATVYPVVIIQKANKDVHEDHHIIYINDDKKHDIPLLSYATAICMNITWVKEYQ